MRFHTLSRLCIVAAGLLLCLGSASAQRFHFLTVRTNDFVLENQGTNLFNANTNLLVAPLLNHFLTPAAAAGAYQPLAANLSTWAGVTPSANGQSLVSAANYATMKSLLSLGNVDNTSDANKPISTATQAALDGKLSTTGNASGLTALNASQLASGTVPDARFPATLPAASGVNLTALNASNLGSGTIPDARFPATLPAASGANLTDINGNQIDNPEALITMTEGGTFTVNSETNHYRLTAPSGVTNFSVNLPASPAGQRTIFMDWDNTGPDDQIVTIKVNSVATDLQWQNRGSLAQTITNAAGAFIHTSFTSGGGNWQSFTAPYILEVTDEDLLELAADGSTGSGPFVRQSGATMNSLVLDQLVVDEFTLPLLSEDPDPPGTGFLRFFARDSDKLPYAIDETGEVSSMVGGSGTGTTNATLIAVTNTPAAYTPDDAFVEGHLKGIDDALAALGAWSPLIADTSSTTVTPLHTNAVSADVTRWSHAWVMATQQTNSASFYVTATANNTGGSLVIVTNTLERLTNSTTASWDAFFSASGANLVLNAKGPAEGVSWKVVQMNTWTHTNYLGATSPYLFEDFFESGTINSTTWPEIVGSAITASTTDPIDGTRSLLSADPSSGAEYITSMDIGADYATVWFGFVINISTPTASGRNIIRIRNEANDADLAQVLVNTSRQYQSAATGGSTSSASSDTIPNTAGQKIAMMIRYDRGTGANATITTYSSTDNMTWTQSRQSANGTSTEYARRIRFINNATWNQEIRIDRAVAKTSEMTPDEILNGL